MENDNSGQNESQPARKKRRKAAAAQEKPADPAQAETLPDEQQDAPQTPSTTDETPAVPQDVAETDAAQPDAQVVADASQPSEQDQVVEPQPADSGAAGELEGAEAAESAESLQSENAEAVEPQQEQVETAEPEAERDEAAESPEEVQEGQAAESDDRMPDGVPVRQVVEALLFATDSPLPAAKIAQILDRGTSRHVRRYIAELNEAYEREGRAFRIEEVAGGYQMLTVPALQPWLAKLLRARQESRLSPTQMETLAVIAYKQPVLRAAVEVIRGVACGDVINRLREMGLVKIVGRAEDVGRPLLYGTTKKFLRVFGLGSLDDLPRVEELRPPEGEQASQASAEPVESKPAEAPQESPPASTNE